jgi:hypothetical protein
MVKRAYCLVMLMMLAQPAAATQMVNLANSARGSAGKLPGRGSRLYD